MTILADLNSIFTNVLLVVHVAVCILLCLVVLMQRPKQEGLGAAFGGGMTDQAFGARTTDVLQKGTVLLGTLLFIVTLALAVLVGAKSKSSNLDKGIAADSEAQIEEAASLPAAEDLEAPAPIATPETESVAPAATAPEAIKPVEPAKPAAPVEAPVETPVVPAPTTPQP